MKSRKSNRFMEIIWLIAAVLSAITCIHAFITRGIAEGLTFFIIFVLASVFYILRRNRGQKEPNPKE